MPEGSFPDPPSLGKSEVCGISQRPTLGLNFGYHVVPGLVLHGVPSLPCLSSPLSRSVLGSALE